mmetsp:Transcript_36067/g.57671  ORF Transcript_36067/g.57671 Transcript_36067/m.57671 type:complete len:535 (-) Transcript_36067:57-1661(-)
MGGKSSKSSSAQINPEEMRGPMPSIAFDQILSLARDNDDASIREICRLGCPPSYANKVGQTALHIGGIWGSVEAVKALLECKADPNAQNSLRGSAPLHAAAMGKGPAERRAECIKSMIAFKADPQLRDNGGELPMDAADDECVRMALGADPLIVHKALWAKDASALADAMKQVKERRVKLTLESPDPKGETALHTAVKQGWSEAVKTLIQAKAAVNTQNNKQQSPLHAAMCDPRLLRILLAAKADVNIQDADTDHDPRFSSQTFQEDPYVHRAALHHVAELCNVWSARLLLENAADPNIKDSKHETPLHLCFAALRNEEMTIEAGSGVRIDGLQKRPEWNKRVGCVLLPAEPSSGRWPVLVDLEEGEMAEGVLLKEDNLQHLGVEMIDLLLEAKADVNASSHVGGESHTLLHDVAKTGDIVLMQKFLAARADINRQDAKMGMSALHLAARSKHHDACRLLVESRADIKQVTSNGKSAAELAKTNRASAATVALLSESDESKASGIDGYVSPTSATVPQTLENLTAEQRAMLFLD